MKVWVEVAYDLAEYQIWTKEPDRLSRRYLVDLPEELIERHRRVEEERDKVQEAIALAIGSQEPE